MKNFKIKLFALCLALLSLRGCGYDRPASAPNLPREKQTYENTVTVLNVGQAKSTLIETEGEFALVDAGYGRGDTEIVPYLQERGVSEIKLLVLTHFHSDHTSDVLEILRNFQVDTILIPSLSQENTPTNSFYKALLEKAEKGQFDLVLAEEGETFEVGGGVFTVLADTLNQPKADDEGKNSSRRINNTSIPLTFTQPVSYGDFIFLDTGDLESDGEALIMDKVPENVTLYNAAHHGSSDSNSYDFLRRINPNMTVISCGRDNDYGHPHRETIENFDRLFLTYVITYEYGNVVYSMEENRILEELY